MNYSDALESFIVNPRIESLSIRGLHGRFDLDISFHRDLNIIYGKNGTAKTTTLHIIANLLSSDFHRFYHLNFSTITAEFLDGRAVALVSQGAGEDRIIVVTGSDGGELKIVKPSDDERYRNSADSALRYTEELEQERRIKSLPYTYFPAFRNVLEALENRKRRDSRLDRYLLDIEFDPRSRSMGGSSRHWTQLQIGVARDLFGPFIPDFWYPTPQAIARTLGHMVRRARIDIAERESDIFIRSFLETFSVLSGSDLGKSAAEPAEETLDEISSLLTALSGASVSIPSLDNQSSMSMFHELEEHVSKMRGQPVNSTFSSILEVYKHSVAQRVEAQRESLDVIRRLFDAINQFLEGKSVGFSGTSRDPLTPRLIFDDGRDAPLRALSSGERHILSMIFAVSQISSNSKVVLIDEPELSLHIDWQRPLIKRMGDLMGDRQLIVTTHSPEIGGNHIERYLPLEPRFAENSDPVDTTIDEDVEDEY